MGSPGFEPGSTAPKAASIAKLTHDPAPTPIPCRRENVSLRPVGGVPTEDSHINPDIFGRACYNLLYTQRSVSSPPGEPSGADTDEECGPAEQERANQEVRCLARLRTRTLISGTIKRHSKLSCCTDHLRVPFPEGTRRWAGKKAIHSNRRNTLLTPGRAPPWVHPAYAATTSPAANTANPSSHPPSGIAVSSRTRKANVHPASRPTVASTARRRGRRSVRRRPSRTLHRVRM